MTPTLNNIPAEPQQQNQEQPKKKCIAKGEEIDQSQRVETKRQRVEKAQTTLRKPFKSPFKCPLKKPIEKGELEKLSESKEHIQDRANRSLREVQSSQPSTPMPSKTSDIRTVGGLLTSSLSSSPLLSPSLARKVPGVHKGLSPLKRSLSPTKTSSTHQANPRLVMLQRQYGNSLRTLNSKRNMLDLLQQAKRIEAQQQDEQLNKLIVLWRGVAQKAAEEVFEGAKKRVDAMGGVKAWREKMNEKQNSFQAWDTYVVESAEWGGGSEAGSEVDGEDTYQRNARVEDASKENESRSGALEVDDEEEFTMGMMLKILNVDLKVIGFDKDGQKWT
ncbi:hypothetical protein KEM55_005438, partial [Ascosphaera atra]